MKERPILFSGPMVCTLLDGSKTQTRRICKQQPYPNGYKWDGRDFLCHNDFLPPSAMLMDGGGKSLYTTSDVEGWESECPYGQPGDRLYVRETWQHSNAPYGPYDADCDVFYRADYFDDPHGPDGEKSPEGRYRFWKPSIHMPRTASRILLEIISVRVELLHGISEADAKAEGVDPATCVHEYYDGYAKLWESINGTGSWVANPWVWVVEFKQVES